MFPPDLEVGYPDAITVFDELVAGDPAGGRRTFIIEDEPGIGRDIRLAFGAERQTIMLRPRIGGPGISDRDAAKDRLLGEAVLTVATLLTPGTLDDIAVAGLRASARAPSLRVVNSKMAHAADRAVQRVGLGSAKEAREALQAFGQGIEKSGLPAATVKDAAGHLIVPGFGKGGAVVYRQSGGKLTLQTVLNWVEGKGTTVVPTR